MTTPQGISVLLCTTDYCGDHSREVDIAQELLPGETVEALGARLLRGERCFADRIEIRLVRPADKTRLAGDASP